MKVIARVGRDRPELGEDASPSCTKHQSGRGARLQLVSCRRPLQPSQRHRDRTLVRLRTKSASATGFENAGVSQKTLSLQVQPLNRLPRMHTAD
jgi:hypothetical protein